MAMHPPHKTRAHWALGIAALATVACGSLERRDGGPAPDAFFFAGQSNAVGFDSGASDLPPSGLDASIALWWRCGDPPPDDADSQSGGWTHLGPQWRGEPKAKGSEPRQYGNFAHPEGGYGPEVSMMRALATKDPTRPLGAIKVAFSGTSLDDWNPVDPVGACYRVFVDEARRALTEKPMAPRALAWIQGESDANAEDAPRYAARLRRLIASLRRDLAAPDLVVLLAVNTRFGMGKNPYVADIVDAQREVAAADPLCTYVDTARATIANGAHFDAQGTRDVGRWLADAYAPLTVPVQ